MQMVKDFQQQYEAALTALHSKYGKILSAQKGWGEIKPLRFVPAEESAMP